MLAQRATDEAKELEAWECPTCGPSKRGHRTPWIMHSHFFGWRSCERPKTKVDRRLWDITSSCGQIVFPLSYTVEASTDA